MRKQEETKPRHRPGQISYPEVLNGEKKCHGHAMAVCQKRKLIAAIVTQNQDDSTYYLSFFRYHHYHATSSSSLSSSSASSSSSSSDFAFEKLSSLRVNNPWAMLFGEDYLFLFGEFENNVAVVDLSVATSESEEERKRTKLQRSSFDVGGKTLSRENQGEEGEEEQKEDVVIPYVCEYTYEPAMNTSRTKLAIVILSFTYNNDDFNGVVILDISKSYKSNNKNKEEGEEEGKVPRENAFPTISAIMDNQDEDKQCVNTVDFSKNDDGARIAYLSESSLKVCDVSTKEKTFEVEWKDNFQTNKASICLFHPTDANIVLFVHGSDVKVFDVVESKAQLRQFAFGAPGTNACSLNFPLIASESRYLVASLRDRGETPSERKNYRLDVIDTLDGTVIQSTPLPVKDGSSFNPFTGGFLTFNTMLLSEKVSGALLVKEIAVCLWNSRKPVFLVREKSASSNRIGDVLRNEWVVLRTVSRFLA